MQNYSQVKHGKKLQSSRETILFDFFVFNGVSIILVEDQHRYYLIHCWCGQKVLNIPTHISPKVNVIAWLGFELDNLEPAVLSLGYGDSYPLRGKDMVI